MSRKSYGIPHKEGLPPVSGSKINSDHTLKMWTDSWEAKHGYTNYYINYKTYTLIDFNRPTLRMPSILLEFYEDINLAYIGLECDNKFQTQNYGAGNLMFPVHIQYSKDGVTWTKLPQNGIAYAHCYSVSNVDHTPVYVFVPPTKLKYKHWRMDLLTADFISSFSDDDSWHIQAVHAGTLDYMNGGVSRDTTDQLTLSDTDLLEANILARTEMPPWASVSLYHFTGMRVDALMMLRDTHGVGVSSIVQQEAKLFWMDKQSVDSALSGNILENFDTAYIPPTSALQHTYFLTKNSFSHTTNSGFIEKVSEMPSTYDWVSNSGNYLCDTQSGDDKLYGVVYCGIGFQHNPDLGTAVQRLQGVATSAIPNPLHTSPDCIIFHNGLRYLGLTHPDQSNTVYDVDYTSTTLSITSDTDTIDASNLTNLIITAHDSASLRRAGTEDVAGLILLNTSSGFFNAGSYSGTGVSGLTVATSGVYPKIVIIKRTDADGYMSVSDYWLSYHLTSDRDGNSGSGTGGTHEQYLELTDSGFTVNTTDAWFNASGGNYLWWAFQ